MNKKIAAQKCKDVLIFAALFGINGLWQSMVSNLDSMEEERTFENLSINKKDLILLYNSLVMMNDTSMIFKSPMEDRDHVKQTIAALFDEVSLKSEGQHVLFTCQNNICDDWLSLSGYSPVSL